MLTTIASDTIRPPRTVGRDTSDESLIKSIAGGDQEAMGILYARHKTRVLRCAMKVVRNLAGAEEVVSEVFHDVWQKAGRFESRSRVSTWLLAITRNKALDARSRRRGEPLDDDFAESIVDEADGPETMMFDKESHGIVHECLTHLSPAHRTIIDLVYLQEKPVGEVAKLIQVPENTVKTRMFYARQRMKVLLVDKGIDQSWHWVQ